jgi:hypothetical protein
VRKLVFILGLHFFAQVQVSFAQTPIDPLRRLQDIQGAYNYNLGINYVPSGLQGIDFDKDGTPYRYSTFEKSSSLSLSGGYSFSRSLGVNATVDWSKFSIRENRNFPDLTDKTLKSNNSLLGSSVGIEFRAAPSSLLDPRFSLGIAYPWSVSAQGQVSLVRDPMMLLGSIGYSRSLRNNSESINIGIGTGFIANEVINLTGSASYSIPIDNISLPATSLSLRTGYKVNQRVDQEIGLRATISNSDSDTRIGIGIEFGGHGVITKKRKTSADISAHVSDFSDSNLSDIKSIARPTPSESLYLR